jgi:hypothetical protein
MKAKTYLLFFIIMNTHLLHAQTDSVFLAEEFIAEVFYGYMTEKSPKTYIKKQTHYPEFIPAIPNETEDRFESGSEIITFWSENASVFQQPKYKKLLIVENLPKPPSVELSKPLFSKSRNYALIEVTRSNYFKTGCKWSWKKFGVIRQYRKEFHTIQYIYKRINGEWVEIYSHLVALT